MTMPYAEDMNYWKTSRTSAGGWLDKSVAFLTEHGADVRLSAKGSNNGKTAFLIEFSFDSELFRCIWPVLDTQRRNSKDSDAERQAATMLYYDIKSRALRLAIHGPRTAFIDCLMLPDGATVAQASNVQLASQAALLPPPSDRGGG